MIYVLDNKGVPVEVPLENVRSFIEFLTNIENRRVASTRRGVVHVSTVFAIYGDAPFLWETMILGGPLDGHQERACTLEEAVFHHLEAVKAAFPKRPPKTVWGTMPRLNPDGTVGSKEIAGLVGPSVWERLLRDEDLV